MVVLQVGGNPPGGWRVDQLHIYEEIYFGLQLSCGFSSPSLSSALRGSRQDKRGLHAPATRRKKGQSWVVWRVWFVALMLGVS